MLLAAQSDEAPFSDDRYLQLRDDRGIQWKQSDIEVFKSPAAPHGGRLKFVSPPNSLRNELHVLARCGECQWRRWHSHQR
jgi:hypothetical protein